ncbi:MAG: tetratricopeptide repeat protein [Bacteroidetes bacterium]|nr:tetratricopeptide repeat protein [Bacteroidota bacterium]
MTQKKKIIPAKVQSGKVKEIPMDPKPLNKIKNGLGILVALFAFVLYVQTVSFDYTLDDGPVTHTNELVKKGVNGIGEILQTDYWFGFKEQMRVPNYRPASLVSLAIEWQLFPDNPHVNHLMNVLLYALTCWLLFLVLCTLFENRDLIFAFVSSLLYVAHPLHTEVVASIKSRDEILCFLFVLAALFFVLKYTAENSIVHLITSLVCFFIALLSKEPAIAFVVIVPLMLFVFTATSVKKNLMVTMGFFSVALIYLAIRHQVLASLNSERYYSVINNSMLATADVMSQKATAFFILLKYIVLLIVPHTLSYDYSFSQIKNIGFSDPSAFLAAMVYLALTIYAFMHVRKKSVMSFSILFFLITLFPASNLMVTIGSTMAERFLYMPSLGYCMVVTFLLLKYFKTENAAKKFQTIKQFLSVHSSVMMIALVITVMYSFKTIARSRDWKNNVSLFGHDVTVADESARAHYNWGSALVKELYDHEKNTEKKNVYLDKAILEFNKTISIFSNYSDAYFYLGLIYTIKEDYLKAISNYQTAIRLFPSPKSKAFTNLGLAYRKTKQFELAVAVLDSAIKADPKDAEPYQSKGYALAGLGKNAEAIIEFQKSIELNASDAASHKSLGILYSNMADYSKAIQHFTVAIRLDSTDAESFYGLGYTYQLTGDSAQAKPFFEKSNFLRNNH